MQKSVYQPVGWQDTDVLNLVKDVYALLGSSNNYLSGPGPFPTLDEVRAILQKLGHVDETANAGVMNHQDKCLGIPIIQDLLYQLHQLHFT